MGISAKGYRATIKKRRLSKILLEARENAGLSHTQVAERLEWDRSKMTRIEGGKWILPDPNDVALLCTLYGIDDTATEALKQLARDSRNKGWWRRYDDVLGGDYVGLEGDATTIRSYDPSYIPGLLQTPEYVAAIMNTAAGLSAEERERRATVRLERQKLLRQPERADCPHIHWVVDEPVLLRRFGSVEDQRAQIQRVIDVARSPRITFQVILLDRGVHAAMTGMFTLLDFADEQDGSIVYLEYATGSQYLEEDDELDKYNEIFGQATKTALNEESSLDYLNNLLTSK